VSAMSKARKLTASEYLEIEKKSDLKCEFYNGEMVTMAGAAIRWLSKENPEIGEAREALTDVVATGHRASDTGDGAGHAGDAGFTRRYPTPGWLWMYRGRAGSGSILRRRCDT